MKPGPKAEGVSARDRHEGADGAGLRARGGRTSGPYARRRRASRSQEPTLHRWKNELHAEQYRRLSEKYGKELEQEAVANARAVILKAHDEQLKMIDKVAKADFNLAPQALKALTDAKKSATQELMQLTGRPISPQGSEGTNEIVKLASKLIEAGLMKPVPGVTLEPVRVINQAEAVDG